MPSVETQTIYEFIVIEDPLYHPIISNLRKYKNIYIFYRNCKSDNTNDKSTVTEYNSENDRYMNRCIHDYKYDMM